MARTGGLGLTWTQIQMVASTAVAAALGAFWISTSQSASTASLNLQRSRQTCRCFPTDDCWPSAAQWSSFNDTLGGKLIATVPLASPCHDDFPGVSYDADRCTDLQNNWVVPDLHDQTTHSVMAGYFANLSCDPFTPRDAPCGVGSYVPYAVNASGADDYARAIAFAREHDIRLVIRNTGHDYLGKSTGAGALALWTHHLKDMAVVDYESAAYTGRAIRLGAGVQAGEAQAAANAEGYVVVEGDCPTVGIAGGYTQGGGTSPLGSKFGLAADQVLEWEVVTADGTLRTATPTNDDADLYWALAGGGGGTYGVVLSMTVKLHANMATAGALLSFSDASDGFWDLVQVFLTNLPGILDAGGVAYWQVLPGYTFSMPQTYFPDGTAEQLEAILQPTIKALDESGTSYSFSTTDYPTFQDAFYAMNPEMNITEMNIGGRLIPRSLTQSNTSATLATAIRAVIDGGAALAGVSMNVSRAPTSPNSAHPQWRDSAFLAFYGVGYDMYNFTANIAGQDTVTNVLSPPLEVITPGGAAYLNEADRNQPGWQDVFYGVNYQRLAKIKAKYDPHGIFWGLTAVGSEGWAIAADGRLCKAG